MVLLDKCCYKVFLVTCRWNVKEAESYETGKRLILEKLQVQQLILERRSIPDVTNVHDPK